jgi:fatty-acyl-CoA synthase
VSREPYGADRFARFWLPDELLVLDAIPRTSTGKFLKSKLRELCGDRLITPPP